jgi:nucleotide-binding universal stress UspA family protein
MHKRILVPLDGSEFAEAALSFAGMLANHNDAEIVLLRVAEYPSEMYSVCYEYPPIDPEVAAKLEEKKRALCLEVERYLDEIAARLEMSGYTVLVKVCDGPVVNSILDATKNLHADLIVMSTHGHSGYEHRMIGATSDRVLYEANVPVLLVRAIPNISVRNDFLQWQVIPQQATPIR